MKKSRLLKQLLTTVFVTVITALSIQAQTTLKGMVKDAKGEPVIGASVVLRGTTVGGLSDFDGNYTFRTDAKGEVTLVVSSVGLKTLTKAVTLSGSEQTENFTLTDDVFNLDQLVVTGTSTSRTQKQM